MQWVPAIVTGVGVVILILTVVLGWIVVPNIIDDQIINEVKLVNGSETWDKWRDIPVPIYLKFHIFNITNVDEVEQGERPKFEEKGPYAYRESRSKKNLSLLDDGEVVQYEEIKLYFFDPAESCPTCSEDDEFNIINVAFLSVMSVLYNLSPGLASLIGNSVLGSERFVRQNVKVGELTFTGFDVRLYTETIGFLLPEEFSQGRFGLYKGENGTGGGVYQIFSGTGRTADFGRVKTWEGNSTLDEWWRPQTPCTMINGTDGSLFPPFVEKSWIMYVFSTDLCRSLGLTYEKEVEHRGIKGYRFVAPKKMLEDPRTNPDNRCFCLEDELEDCPKGGVIHIKGCKSGAPIMMSTPHFLDGDLFYQEESGLVPDKELHETIIDIEPNTGLNLQANKRIQVNVEVKRMMEVKALTKVRDDMVFPLLWADEEAKLDEENADDLKGRLLTPLKIVNAVKWALLGVSLVTIGIGAAIFIMRRRRRVETV